MKIDFTKMTFLNRDGSTKLLNQPAWKMISEAIYDRADTKALDVLSDKLWNCNGKVELEETEVDLLRACMEGIRFFTWLKNPVISYLDTLNPVTVK